MGEGLLYPLEVGAWWWSRGVGKIMNREVHQDEYLVDHCLPSQGCDRAPPC